MSATRGEIALLTGLAASVVVGIFLSLASWNSRVSFNRPLEAIIEKVAQRTPHHLLQKGIPLIDPEKRPSRVLDINRATLEDLDSLPGVGKVLAQRIIEFRDKRGGIRTLDELSVIDGLSPKKLIQISSSLTTMATAATVIPPPKVLNLNLATAEELEALPGIGPTMAAAILELRRQKGGFRSLEDLQDVPGLGEATFNKFADRVGVK